MPNQPFIRITNGKRCVVGMISNKVLAPFSNTFTEAGFSNKAGFSLKAAQWGKKFALNLLIEGSCCYQLRPPSFHQKKQTG